MSVDINPQELGFHRPFTVEVVENLKIKNPNSQPIAFKVKTTAPKQYCVRPNSGRVEPNREVEVQVILQAMKQEPPPNTKCRDKFLVQSIAITPDKDFTNLASIWDNVDKSSVQEKKIRVAFLDSEGAPAATLTTPEKSTSASHADATPEIAPAGYLSPSDHATAQPELKPVIEEPPSDFAAAAAVATTQNSDPGREELKQQLLEAEKRIAQLKKDGEGLRLRKPATMAEEKPSTAPAPLAQDARPVNEGVPIQITALLCLVSFLLAYIFF
ncbi:PapD-like protein [Xylaria intraflava]|nr:PapD-like protein [Xylaria intraflava]